jgi:methionyl-tRNA formyltransferase
LDKKQTKLLSNMLKIIIIGQGSQTIQLIRELFSLGVTPNNLKALTVSGDFNLSYIEFLTYYKIDYGICDINSFKTKTHSLISDFAPDIVISFSNPFIIHKEILSLNTKFINFHPGILPNYKGSLSTVHSLIKNETFVGGTWHYIDEYIDTGNIIKVVKTPSKNLNVFTLNHKIFSLGIHFLGEIIEKVKNNYPGTKQKKHGSVYSNKFPDVSKLDVELQKKILYFPPKFLLF